MKSTISMMATGVLLMAAMIVRAHAVEPNDAQIAHIVVTANQVDIDAGKLATANAKSPEVKQFAQQMITDHTAVNKSAVALATRLNVKPQDNETSQSLKKGGDDNLANLRKLQDDKLKFDRAYIDHEVTYHQAVIDALDKTLVPNAKNAELKSLLEQTRPAFVAHLEHAKRIQTSLGNSSK